MTTESTYVYIINLDESVERMKATRETCSKLGFRNVNRFSAVRGSKYINSTEMLKDEISDEFLYKENNKKWGEIGCWLSHTRLIKHIADNHDDNDTVLVLEDDARCDMEPLEFKKKYMEAIQKTKDFDILYLFRFYDDRMGNFTIYPGIQIPYLPLSTIAYIIKPSYARKLTETVGKMTRPIDNELANYGNDNRSKVWVTHPPLIVPDPTEDSTIAEGFRTASLWASKYEDFDAELKYPFVSKCTMGGLFLLVIFLLLIIPLFGIILLIFLVVYIKWFSVKTDNEIFKLESIQDKMKYTLLAAKKAFTRAQVPFFVCDGAALGYHRSKQFIEWDGDIDICLYKDDWNNNIIKDMENSGFTLKHTFGKEISEYTFKHNITNIFFDVFLIYPQLDHSVLNYTYNGGCEKKPEGRCIYSHSLIRPEKVNFCGTSFYMAPLSWIKEEYGEEWKIPKKYTYKDSINNKEELCPSMIN